MGGTTSRLFSKEREAAIAYEIALKEQYGADYADYRYDSSQHNERTMGAMIEHNLALRNWHRSASGNSR